MFKIGLKVTKMNHIDKMALDTFKLIDIFKSLAIERFLTILVNVGQYFWDFLDTPLHLDLILCSLPRKNQNGLNENFCTYAGLNFTRKH